MWLSEAEQRARAQLAQVRAKTFLFRATGLAVLILALSFWR